MNANVKGLLHGVINIAGNGVIFELIPQPYKMWALLVFNLLQVVYAFLDPSYTVHLMGKKKEE